MTCTHCHRPPETVTTAEELEALPDETVILDASNHAYQPGEAFGERLWYGAGSDNPSRSANIQLPARILWRPRP